MIVNVGIYVNGLVQYQLNNKGIVLKLQYYVLALNNFQEISRPYIPHQKIYIEKNIDKTDILYYYTLV